jgi:hypothetical protein
MLPLLILDDLTRRAAQISESEPAFTDLGWPFGRQPRWIVAQLRSGKKLDDFRIQPPIVMGTVYVGALFTRKQKHAVMGPPILDEKHLE